MCIIGYMSWNYRNSPKIEDQKVIGRDTHSYKTFYTHLYPHHDKRNLPHQYIHSKEKPT